MLKRVQHDDIGHDSSDFRRHPGLVPGPRFLSAPSLGAESWMPEQVRHDDVGDDQPKFVIPAQAGIQQAFDTHAKAQRRKDQAAGCVPFAPLRLCVRENLDSRLRGNDEMRGAA